jgi:protein TonB
MKKLIFISLLLIVSSIVFAQTEENKSDSCYSIKQQDTLWNLLCVHQNPPAYPGGDKAMFSFIKKTVLYPREAKENGVQGKVFITFVIDKVGNVTDGEIFKGVTIPEEVAKKHRKDKEYLDTYKDLAKQLDTEALLVVNMMPKWTPGMQDGKPVKVRYILPVSFKLQ